MKVVLYQPDIAGNVGTVARLCHCMGLELNIIEPCGFLFDDRKLKRAGMDYLDLNVIKRYKSFQEFRDSNKGCRVVLLTTKASERLDKFKFEPSDILMIGRESAGVPDEIHNAVDKRVIIPMKNNSRCINAAMSCTMVVAVAMNQCNLY